MRVLIIEDSATFRAIHSRYLNDAGYETEAVSSGEEAMQVLELKKIDIILMDVQMKGLSGFETAELIRETFPKPWLPIIFATADESDTSYQKAMDSGGDDYLIKPIKEAALIAKVESIERILNIQNELSTANQNLQRLNKDDPLTSLHNRRFTIETAENTWNRMKRLDLPISVFMIDVDHFKNYNDTYGHLEGDECLKLVASTIKETIKRETDIIGRYGGEEFLCVLPETDTASAFKIAQKLRESIFEKKLIHENTDIGQVTVSIGCATCSTVNKHDLEGLIRHADALLYTAKSEGRNQVCWDDYPTSHKLIHEEDSNTDSTLTNKTNTYPKSGRAGIVLMLALLISVIAYFFWSQQEPPFVETEVLAVEITPEKTVEDEEKDDDALTIIDNFEPTIDIDIEPEWEQQKVTPEETILAWTDSWSNQDLDEYFSHYSEKFVSDKGLSFEEWKRYRAPKIRNRKLISVVCSHFETLDLTEETAVIKFKQHYHSDKVTDFGYKTLQFEFNVEKGRWLILKEKFSKEY